MARRWTPQRFVALRRIRVIASVLSLSLAMGGTFAFTARKSVALNVNGETTQVTTYAMTATRLLQEQGIDVKTHDIVQTSSGNTLADHAVVTVRSAYQTTINIDGVSVPFWTVATSAEQLLGFFEENETNATKITVDIDNVYNQLTGGLVINRKGPVTVIADGKSSVAPNGKLPAASILDSKGIVLGKEDRVSVEKDGDKTILRVRRVTHGEETRTVTIPFSTRTIVDNSLAAGQTEVRQQGVNGEKTQVYDVTYVDGEAESETLKSETVTKMAVDQIIAVGPSTTVNKNDSSTTNGSGSSSANGSANDSTSGDSGSGSEGSGSTDNGGNADNGNGSGNGNGNGNGNTGGGDGTGDNSGSNTDNNGTDNNGNANNGGTSNDSGSDNNGSADDDSGNSGGNTTPDPTPTPSPDNGSSSGRLWHPTPAQAQAYAAGAAAQRGWTGNEWDCLVKLWTRESSWLWYAENASSGAYGIPQALPADKMATFGANYRDDAAVQIDWGLAYIAERYGSPSVAWQHSEDIGWY